MKIVMIILVLCTVVAAQHPRPVAFDMRLPDAQRVLDGECIKSPVLDIVSGPLSVDHLPVVLDLNHLRDGRYLASAIRFTLGVGVLVFPVDALDPIPTGFEHVYFVEADKNPTGRRQRLITRTPPPARFCD